SCLTSGFLFHLSLHGLAAPLPHLHSFPTRRSSDLLSRMLFGETSTSNPPSPSISTTRLSWRQFFTPGQPASGAPTSFQLQTPLRSEEHTSELQSRENLVCRLLLEKKKKEEDTELNA